MCKATLATSCSDCEQKKAIAEEQSKMKYQYVMEFDVGIHSAFFLLCTKQHNESIFKLEFILHMGI